LSRSEAYIFKFQFKVYSCRAKTMRRILATIALLLIGSTTLEPASLAMLFSSSVPMCCRKGGQHHCTGSPLDPVDGVARLHAVSPVCPHRGEALAASAHFQFVALSEFAQPLPRVCASLTALDSSGSHLFAQRGVFDRGPPQSSLPISS
jgi:hypothetical protein